MYPYKEMELVVLFLTDMQELDNAEIVEITMVSGKKFQKLQGYTYGSTVRLKSSMRYRCTQGCGVYLYKSFDGHLMDPVPVHNHPPPRLYLTSSGHYMALR
ncbi:unnamed protein product [Euphydryas editha]|uniref:FLYWCH-type domain-containing protein n=1 Tax=Euphydryas editha TaxID=104508 RepID=A0AAU9TJT2_EUPED|nr:unnamed protein product [Euphydryas editha]